MCSELTVLVLRVGINYLRFKKHDFNIRPWTQALYIIFCLNVSDICPKNTFRHAIYVQKKNQLFKAKFFFASIC